MAEGAGAGWEKPGAPLPCKQILTYRHEVGSASPVGDKARERWKRVACASPVRGAGAPGAGGGFNPVTEQQAKAQPDEREAPKATHKRDAAATRQRILRAASEAFALHGFAGARIDQIARGSQSNVQMIYRYFGSKEELYSAVLEDIYAHVRASERNLDLGACTPLDGMRRLVEFTFDYLRDNPQFVAIIRNENMIGGRFVRQLPMVSVSTLPLVAAISDLLKRGRESGCFRATTDGQEVYVTILSLCMIHLAQRDTLSAMFQRDLSDPVWLAQRRSHVVSVVLSFLCHPYQVPFTG